MDAKPTPIKFESARMCRREKVIYDPTASLDRFAAGVLTERERRYVWAERMAMRKRLTERSER